MGRRRQHDLVLGAQRLALGAVGYDDRAAPAIRHCSQLQAGGKTASSTSPQRAALDHVDECGTIASTSLQ
jgi:hypothetical protein